jgi:hypothetical protein
VFVEPLQLSYENLTINRAGPSLFVGVLDGILLLRVFALYHRSKRGVFQQCLDVSAILKQDLLVFITLFILVIGEN